MKVQAIHKNARMSPRKVRLIADLVRGMSVQEADVQLQFRPGKASEIVRKVMQSAAANAAHNHDIERDSLRVADILVGKGIVLKRYQPVSKGMAHPILKRFSHVTVVVEGEPAKKTRKAKKADIQTLTADQYTSLRHDHEEEVDTEAPKEDLRKKQTGEGRTVDTFQDKTEEAFQKTKMQQLGGDRAKTNRRRTKKGD